MKTKIRSRVVVTGMGVVTSIGNDVPSFWSACLAGKSRVETIPENWRKFYESTSRVWSPLALPDFLKRGLGRSDLLVQDPVSLIAIAAADEAIASSGISSDVGDATVGTCRLDGVDGNRCGVFIGTGLGGAKSPFNNYATHILKRLHPHLQNLFDSRCAANGPVDEILELLQYLEAHPRVNPLVICQTMPNASSALLAIRYGVHGSSDTFCYACASGTVAIGRAYEAIQRGQIDVAIAGGTEYLGDYAGAVFMGFDKLQTLAKPYASLGQENRPFDKDRSGFLFAEGGAGILILESLQHAIRRGAEPIAEISGFSMSSDAHSLVTISSDTTRIGVMLQELLSCAGITANNIDYINAHGTGTKVNDEVEATIISKLFGRDVLVNSTKSLLGHTIGASGAIECIVSALTINTGRVHPNRNLYSPIGELNFPKEMTSAGVRRAISQNFGFGGHNAALLLSKI